MATLTLNRPERMNALGKRLVEELIVAIAQADSDDDVRVVVITGADCSSDARFGVVESHFSNGVATMIMPWLLGSRCRDLEVIRK